MTEQRNRPHPPTFDDYRAMMGDVRAPCELKSAVLAEARSRRRAGHPAATGSRRSTRPHAPLGLRRTRATLLAVCLVLLVGAGTTALALGGPDGFGIINDLPAENAAPDEGVAKGPLAPLGNSMELDVSRFRGGSGYSGPWYNPADDSFWSWEWAGYKYSFLLSCTGNNIETVTYELEGEREYFEIIDETVTPEQRANGKHVYRYVKTVTFDYDYQNPIDNERIVDIYLGFPLSDAGLAAHRSIMADGHSDELERQLKAAIEEGAAHEFSGTVLHVTATYADSSTETKSYRIEAPDLSDPTRYTFTEITD